MLNTGQCMVDSESGSIVTKSILFMRAETLSLDFLTEFKKVLFYYQINKTKQREYKYEFELLELIKVSEIVWYYKCLEI